MKNLIFILSIFIVSCSGINREELVTELIENSYQWNIQLGDKIVTQELYFVNDSIYTLVFEDDNQKYAQFGYWDVTENFLYTTLFLNDIIDESSFRVNSWDGKTLKLSKGEYSYEAVKINNPESDLIKDVVGSWIAPLDSFPRTLPEYEETGKFLMNPTFTFTSDSFSIRTEDYYKNGRIKIINGTTEQIILETEPYYSANKILIVEKHTHNSLNIRFKNNMGQWHLFQLKRINGVQQQL